MSSASGTVTEGEILSHAIETIGASHWHSFAPMVSELTLPARDLDRVDCLLEKSRNASISDSERAELEKYLRVANFLDLMRARALHELQRTQG